MISVYCLTARIDYNHRNTLPGETKSGGPHPPCFWANVGLRPGRIRQLGDRPSVYDVRAASKAKDACAGTPPCRWRCEWIRFADSSSSVFASTSAGVASATTAPCSSTTARSAISPKYLQLMRRRDDRLPPVVPGFQQLDHLALAARIQRRGRLIQQQHVGIEHDHRSQRHPLFFPAREPVRRAILQMFRANPFQRPVHPLQNLLSRPAQLQRSKRHFVKHRGIEKLNVRILKNHSHPPPELQREAIVLHRLSVSAAPRKRIVPRHAKCSPSINRSSVLLPLPLAPSSAIRSPAAHPQRKSLQAATRSYS